MPAMAAEREVAREAAARAAARVAGTVAAATAAVTEVARAAEPPPKTYQCNRRSFALQRPPVHCVRVQHP